MNAARARVVAILIIIAFVAVEIDVARGLSATWDEPMHAGAGYGYVAHGEIRLGPDHPPLAKLIVGAALRALGVREGSAAEIWARASDVMSEAAREQGEYGERIAFHENPAFAMPLARAGADSVLFAARLALIAIFPAILAASVWTWARRRFGEAGGLVALIAAVTHPDVLGHSALVGFDAPCAAMCVLAGLALDRVIEGGGARWLVLLGVALGAAIATKFTALLLVPAFAVVALGAIARPVDDASASVVHPVGAGNPRARARGLALGVLSVFALAMLVVWASYLGREPFGALRRGIASIYVCNPESYAGNLLGDYAPHFWSYFVVALTLKTPLGTLALVLLAAIAATAGLGRRARDEREARPGLARELAIHAPAIAILAAASAFGRPSGTRYVLPALPFVFVSIGRVAVWCERSRARWAAVAIALAASIGAAAIDHPFHTSATNALAGDARFVHRKLDDSCQDWGQSMKALAAWQRARGIDRLTVVTWVPVRGDALLDAYGVRGETTTVADTRPLFFPERGRVYAVSAHLCSRAIYDEAESRRRAAALGVAPAELVLGKTILPSEIIGGGSLIFDRR